MSRSFLFIHSIIYIETSSESLCTHLLPCLRRQLSLATKMLHVLSGLSDKLRRFAQNHILEKQQALDQVRVFVIALVYMRVVMCDCERKLQFLCQVKHKIHAQQSSPL